LQLRGHEEFHGIRVNSILLYARIETSKLGKAGAVRDFHAHRELPQAHGRDLKIKK